MAERKRRLRQKGFDKIVGCAGFDFGKATMTKLSDSEGELGYWNMRLVFCL